MLDLTPTLLPTLKSHTFPGLEFDKDFEYQLPQYAGNSILNLPSTLCSLLGVPPLGNAGTLNPEILTPLQDLAGSVPFERVILILMDALALHRFQKWMSDGTAPQWKHLLKDGLLASLTSVVPSTTATALTTIWTGLSPAQHAIAGYEMWLKEYGLIANMIRHNPASFQSDTGALSKAGFDPLTFLQPHTTLGTHLAAHFVTSYAFQPAAISNSGLSEMLFPDVNVRPFTTTTEMWINLRDLFETQIHQRMFTWVYWGEVDHFSHLYGPDDIRPGAEFSAFCEGLQKHFIDPLSPQARQKTLLILTADHGALTTLKNKNLELINHPNFNELLHMQPSGASRLPYVFLRPNQEQAFTDYIDAHWPGEFQLFDPKHLVETGLFGPGRPHPKLFDRLGDRIVIPKNTSYWWWANKKNILLGRHGGLAPEEMLVPFAALNLS